MLALIVGIGKDTDIKEVQMIRTIMIMMLALMVMAVAATTTVSCSIESPNKEIYKIEYKGGLE